MKDACLNCQLEICDDKDARCFYQIQVLAPKRLANNQAAKKYRHNNRAARLATERQWRGRYKDAINARRREKRKAKRDLAHDPANGVEMGGGNVK